jgi:predicted Zn-dependent protease
MLRKISFLLSAAALVSQPVMAGTPSPFPAGSRLNAKIVSPAPFTQKEKDLGAKEHPNIINEFGGAYQVSQTNYVVRVSKKIASQSGLANADGFNVTMLNSSVNNAFAIPGGYAYITRQLVALCNSEAEMAGVMGHEVGHGAARHAASRQKQGTLAQIGAIVGTVAGLAIGNAGGLLGVLGSGLRNYSSTVAQLFALKYSRSQEEQADDLGVLYLSKAGYDPSALSSMLNSLAMQSALDAKVAGHGDGRIPEWSSTHPDPIKRVARSAQMASAYPASTNRNVDGHLNEINGMLYDDDPKEGVIDGQNFIHPIYKFKFSAPTGFGLQNGSKAITINGNGGQALFTMAAFSGDRTAYVNAALAGALGAEAVKSLSVGAVQTTTVNGIPAFYSKTTATTKSGQVTITVFAYEMEAGSAYHFVALAPANAAPFDNMYQSMARLSNSEAAAVKPRKIKIVTAGSSDTIASMGAKMAYSNLQADRFQSLNGIATGSALTSGRKYKIVVY